MIPSNPGKMNAKRKVMASTLPSSASMLSDLRDALLNQVAHFKRESFTRQFETKEIQSLHTLVQTVQLLDANTLRLAEDVSLMVEDMTPEQLEAIERDARKLLSEGEKGK